jgi:hypothetical protein
MIAGSSKLTDSWVLPHLLALFLVELLGPIMIPETSDLARCPGRVVIRSRSSESILCAVAKHP